MRYFTLSTRGCMSLSCVFGLLMVGGCAQTPSTADDQQPEESVFSESLRFQGEVVEELPSGLAIRKTAILGDKRFEWIEKADGLVAEEIESLAADATAPDIDSLSVEELAEQLRGIALFRGHKFREAKPATELAIEVKRLRDMERRGAAAEEFEKILPTIATSQGSAEPTRDLDKAEEGEPAPDTKNTKNGAEVQQAQPETPARQETREEGESDNVGSTVSYIVHGVDDRRVMNNRSWPHRTHIVFDNTGSTTSINGSQGSGTLIGPSTAMSVAHVFWNESANTWESSHRWAPGYDSQDTDPSPYGEWYGCYWVTIPTAYTIYESTEYDFAVLNFNVGCSATRNGVNSDRPGATVGWLGLYPAPENEIESRTGYLRGYPSTGNCGNPASSCNVRLWGDISWSSENDARSNTVRHQADSSGGQSGSGFYHYAAPCSGCTYGPYVVGMHRAGFTSYNEARRATSWVLSFMRSYSSDY